MCVALTNGDYTLSLSRLLLLFPAATFQLLSPREPELLAHTHNISKEISEINSSGIFFSPFFSRNCQLLIGLHKLSASPVKFFCRLSSQSPGARQSLGQFPVFVCGSRWQSEGRRRIKEKHGGG